MPLPDPLSALLTPAAYPHPAEGMALMETPLSWVLLVGDFAYKLKRPVRYPYVDQTDSAHREQLCHEELRLNRRFAPGLYLEVCAIVSVEGRAHMGGQGPILEHAVRMRRFPSSEELDQLLERQAVDPHELAAFGHDLAHIHAGLAVAQADQPWATPEQVQTIATRNLQECAEAAATFGTAASVQSLQEPLQRLLSESASVMVERRASGHIRECHGDLHCRNLVRQGGKLLAFDCLEYEPAFRWIDVADEIAFLASDLSARGAHAHAHAFLGGYLEESGDYSACRLLRVYRAHRSLVRAKVAAVSGAQASGEPRKVLRREHVNLLRHASAALGRHTPALLLMHGLSGSGKTHLAKQLAICLDAIHIRSDIERKRRAGLKPEARTTSAPEEGIYSPESSAALYVHLAHAAETVLKGGYTVIVDATFLLRQQRTLLGELAQGCGIPSYLLHCTAPEDVLRARIVQRKTSATDPSEADEAVLNWQLAHQQVPAPEEPFKRIIVDTTAPDALEQVLRALPAIAARGADRIVVEEVP